MCKTISSDLILLALSGVGASSWRSFVRVMRTQIVRPSNESQDCSHANTVPHEPHTLDGRNARGVNAGIIIFMEVRYILFLTFATHAAFGGCKGCQHLYSLRAVSLCSSKYRCPKGSAKKTGNSLRRDLLVGPQCPLSFIVRLLEPFMVPNNRHTHGRVKGNTYRRIFRDEQLLITALLMVCFHCKSIKTLWCAGGSGLFRFGLSLTDWLCLCFLGPGQGKMSAKLVLSPGGFRTRNQEHAQTFPLGHLIPSGR